MKRPQRRRFNFTSLWIAMRKRTGQQINVAFSIRDCGRLAVRVFPCSEAPPNCAVTTNRVLYGEEITWVRTMFPVMDVLEWMPSVDSSSRFNSRHITDGGRNAYVPIPVACLLFLHRGGRDGRTIIRTSNLSNRNPRSL